MVDPPDEDVPPPPPPFAGPGSESGTDPDGEKDLAIDPTDEFPDGYDHRRDIYAKDREDAYNPNSAYHLATHTPHLKNCPICVQANSKFRAHRRKKEQGHPRTVTIEKFGDLVTMDIVTVEKVVKGNMTTEELEERKKGLRCVLVVYDV